MFTVVLMSCSQCSRHFRAGVGLISRLHTRTAHGTQESRRDDDPLEPKRRTCIIIVHFVLSDGTLDDVDGTSLSVHRSLE